MKLFRVTLLLAIFCASLAGCATSRDTRNVAIRGASLDAAQATYEIKFIPGISSGDNIVFVRKQNAQHYFKKHSKDSYERIAFQLPTDYSILERIDVNDPALSFHFTTGRYENNWLYNAAQEGFLWVHRETDTTIELCLDVKVHLKWAQTYSKNSKDEAIEEAADTIALKRFYVFVKNDRNDYFQNNQVPSTMGLSNAAD